MRASIALLLIAIGSLGFGQTPDVRFKVDALASVRFERSSSAILRGYDIYGKPGTVGLTLVLDAGLRTFVSQRIQRPEAGMDRELLDEFYVEDQGIWKVGKQYIPFGYRSIISESVLAARADTNLLFEGLPISLAFLDAGDGRQSGVAARVGSPQWSASILAGDHFGENAASFGVIRRPELARSRGRGYQRIYGAEFIQRVGKFTFRVEGVAAERPNSAQDDGFTVWDSTATIQTRRGLGFEFGYSRVVQTAQNFVRLGATSRLDERTTFEPVIRFRDGKFYDAAIQLRFRF
jgi:hypothetical protein